MSTATESIKFFGGYKEVVDCRWCFGSGRIGAGEHPLIPIDPHDCNIDDTRYRCPECDGIGYVVEEVRR